MAPVPAGGGVAGLGGVLPAGGVTAGGAPTAGAVEGGAPSVGPGPEPPITPPTEPNGEWIGRARPAELGRLAFAEGSMGPKVAAACAFVEAGGRLAAIGSVTCLPTLIEGRAGTVIAA